MSSIRKYAAVNTKVRAMQTHLLSTDDYNHLLSLKSIEEIVYYLKKNTDYKNCLENISAANKIDEIESKLKIRLFRQLDKLMNYLINEDRKLFKALYMRFEVSNLKLYLRRFARGESDIMIKEKLILSDRFGDLNYEELLQAKSLKEFIERLQPTDYYSVLKNYLDEKGSKRLFYFEMNLDRLYFKKLESTFHLKNEKKNKDLFDLLGLNVDLLNIQWIYRGKFYYNLSAEELINYTLGFGRYLSYKKLKELCYIRRKDNFINWISDSHYSELVSGDNFEIFMERSMERYIFKFFHGIKKKSTMNILMPLIHMHLLEYEMRDLFSIMESKKYNIPIDEAKKFLVREL